MDKKNYSPLLLAWLGGAKNIGQIYLIIYFLIQFLFFFFPSKRMRYLQKKKKGSKQNPGI